MKGSFSILEILFISSLFFAKGQAGRVFKFVPGQHCGTEIEIKTTIQTTVNTEVDKLE